MSQAEEAQVADWFAARADKMIETACARVFLTGDRAFKVKRRVDLGYLDFSTIDRRHWALTRELEFNRPTAPDIYRALRRLTRTLDGGLELDGAGAVAEWALEMRRFDDRAVLAAQPQVIDGALADTLGRTVARAHASSPPRPDGGGAAGLKYTLESNAELLGGLAERLGPEPVSRLVAATTSAFERLAPRLEARRLGGFVRRCHGDLHLGNILLEEGKPILFDCIEFSDLISDIDVQYDLAFLLMDLAFRGRRDAAVRVCSAYLDEAGRSQGEGLLEGLDALPLMLSVRAAVRAHVSANSGDDASARAYLAAALEHLFPPPPALAAVGGFSGTGKSTFARLVAPALGASPGAVILRTDEIRKRLLGVDALARLPIEAYGEDVSQQVHDVLFAEAARLLAVGRAVVLDATFIDPGIRVRAEQVARQAQVPFRAAWLEAPAEMLMARVEGRRNDASDATAPILASQLAHGAGEVSWPRVDVRGAMEPAAQAWLGTA